MKFYSLLLGLSYRRQRTHFWTRFLKKLIPVLILVFLIDMNARHFREMVGRLNDWWSVTRTQMEMGEIAAALDAEYASTAQYPEPDAFRDFVRHWVRPRVPRDPYYDRWSQPLRFRAEASHYEILSCGPDRTCGTTDDVRRIGGLGTRRTSEP